MELPSWLKIENLIGKLNLSGWFKYEKHISVTNYYNTQNIQAVSLDVNQPLKVIDAKEIPIQKVTKKSGFEFTDTEKSIIDSINKIHGLIRSDYDFSDDYGQALEHIKNKAQRDWFMTAALHIANAVQSGETELGLQNFFNCFQLDDNTEKNKEFTAIKVKMSYSYKRLQNMRHADKSGELKQHMISEYRRVIHEQNTIPDDECCQVFIDFQDLLKNLFRNYKLKEL